MGQCCSSDASAPPQGKAGKKTNNKARADQDDEFSALDAAVSSPPAEAQEEQEAPLPGNSRKQKDALVGQKYAPDAYFDGGEDASASGSRAVDDELQPPSQRAPPPPTAAVPRKVDPEEEEARKRRAELMEEVTAPRIIDFGGLETVEDDADGNAVPAPDKEDVIEAFNNDFSDDEDNAPPANASAATAVAAAGTAAAAPAAATTATPAAGMMPTDTWFRSHGLPLPEVSWYQTTTKIYISILPSSDFDAGWDVDFNTLRFVAYGSEDCAQADMSFFQPCGSSTFEARGENLDIVVFKQDRSMWPQLFQADAATLKGVTWLTRDMEREAQEAAETEYESEYEYEEEDEEDEEEDAEEEEE